MQVHVISALHFQTFSQLSTGPVIFKWRRHQGHYLFSSVSQLALCNITTSQTSHLGIMLPRKYGPFQASRKYSATLVRVPCPPSRPLHNREGQCNISHIYTETSVTREDQSMWEIVHNCQRSAKTSQQLSPLIHDKSVNTWHQQPQHATGCHNLPC